MRKGGEERDARRGEARRGLRVVLTILLGIGLARGEELGIIAIQLRPGWGWDALTRVLYVVSVTITSLWVRPRLE